MPYEFSSDYNPFLGAISAKLIRSSPKSLRDYTIRETIDHGRRLVEIWFRTAGCRYFVRGGCAMCNYGYGQKVTSQSMVASVADALAQAQLNPDDTLLITPSGSMLDESEVPPSAYEGIMKLVKECRTYRFEAEAQAQYITADSMLQYRTLIDDRHLQIIAGLESANPWIRRNCLNKDLPTNTFLKALAAAKENDVIFSINILLGVPFLSERESIEDAAQTVTWALDQGVDEIYLFPVHIKIGTITHWLWQRGYYAPPSLWSLAEVLGRYDAHTLRKISVAWHKPYYVTNANPRMKMQRIPFTCPSCYDRVVALLDQFIATRSSEIVDSLQQFDCACKISWRNAMLDEPRSDLQQRVRSRLQEMSIGILGANWFDSKSDALEEALAHRPDELVPNTIRQDDETTLSINGTASSELRQLPLVNSREGSLGGWHGNKVDS